MKGKPCISSYSGSRTVIWEGNCFAPTIALGLLGINRGFCVLPAWRQGAADARLGVEDPRNDFLPLINVGKQRGSECNEKEGTQEGMGEKGGKEGRLTNKQKSPNPSERRLQNKLKLLWQLVCVGSNTRLRMHGIKTNVMFSS